MNYFFTLITCAAVVSLDSFVAGFSMSLNKKPNIMLPFAVSIVTLLLCLTTTFIGSILKNWLDAYADYFGSAILFVLAVFSFLKRDEERRSLSKVTFSESIAIGAAVGADAAVANLSLAMDGYGIAAPLLFAVTHYFTVFLGQKLAQKITLEHTNILTAAVLFSLAVIKLL